MYTRYLGGFAPVGIQPEIIRAGVMPFLLTVPLVGIWVLCIVSPPVRRWLITMLIGVVVLTAFVFATAFRIPTWSAQRSRFARQFGFDPVARVQSDYHEELPAILKHGTGLPVIDFRDILEGRLPRR